MEKLILPKISYYLPPKCILSPNIFNEMQRNRMFTIHWKSSDQNTYFPAYTFSLIYQNSISPNQKDEKCIRHSIKNARFCQKPRPVLVCPYQALQTRLIYNTLYLRHDAPLKLPKCRMSSQCTPSVPSNAWCSPNQFNSGIVHMPSSRDAFDVQDSLTRT